MDTSRIDCVKAPQHRGTPRSYVQKRPVVQSGHAMLGRDGIPFLRRFFRLVLLGVEHGLGFGATAKKSHNRQFEDYAVKYGKGDDVNYEGYDFGVPRCCSAFTPSMRLVSRRGCRGWSLFRF